MGLKVGGMKNKLFPFLESKLGDELVQIALPISVETPVCINIFCFSNDKRKERIKWSELKLGLPEMASDSKLMAQKCLLCGV